MARKAAASRLGIALVTCMLLVAPAAAQSPQDQCAGKDGVPPDQRIAACSTVIDNGNAAPRERADAFLNRANASYAKRDYDGAIVDYGAAIGLDPDNAAFHAARGRAYRSKRDYDHALADFDTAIRLDPNLATAFGGRGIANLLKGNDDQAIADLSEAIRRDPNVAESFDARGRAYRHKQDYDRAFGDFNEAIRLDPKSAPARVDRGEEYYRRKDYEHAVADCDEPETTTIDAGGGVLVRLKLAGSRHPRPWPSRCRGRRPGWPWP